MKEETLAQVKQQLRKTETIFQEEIERIKKETYDSISKEYDHKANFDINRTV